MTEPRGQARAARPRGQPDAGRVGTDQSETERRARERARVRSDRYLVAPVPPQVLAPTIAPIDPTNLIDQLEKDDEVRLIRTITSAPRAGGADYPQIAVVEMAADHAATLATSPQLHIEADHPLRYGQASIAVADPGMTRLTDTTTVTFEVSDGEEPLPGAAVHVLCERYLAHAVTDESGKAQLNVPTDEIDHVPGVLVRPARGCWSRWLAHAALSATEPNLLVCTQLEHAGGGETGGWSARAMGFDRLPPTYLGHGVRLAIIDSGASAEAGLGDQVADGLDVQAQDGKAWLQDLLGSGTHAAALVATTDEAAPQRGLANEVEIHACKVMPGGRHSDLIEALDYCLAREIDVVDIGVGSSYPSWLVAAKIEQIRRAGIASVAAAGDGGAVSFPASLPTVLAVAAIGRLGTFPPETYHSTQIIGPVTPEGYFPARLSAYGAEVDVSAPGVSVVSATAGGGYEAADGTAIASAHVAALAALVLAHHPEFRDGYRIRGTALVDRLHTIIRSSSRPLPGVDPRRTGAGLPDAVAAVGLGHSIPPVTAATGAGWPVQNRLAGTGGAAVGAQRANVEPALVQLRRALQSAGLARPD